MTFPAHIALTLGACFASLGAAAAPGADPNLPPPGLYRVDLASNSAYRDGTTVAVQQSGPGAGTLRGQKPGSAPATHALPNTGARQICIGARNSSFNPLAMNGKSNCKNASTTQSPAGTTFAAQCDIIDFKSVVRKLGPASWEISTHVEQHAGGAGAPPASLRNTTMVTRLNRVADSCTPAH
jgi:hypothetical protein